jgi:DNA-binding GntR family transcriptional regulator
MNTVHDPIQRPSLHDQLRERLRTLIIAGELPPDSRIDEKALCARFGVSRTPLREVLKVLATEGLVTLLPNRGARVAGFDLADLTEAFPIMGALEALAGKIAAANATDAEIAAIEALHAAMTRAYGDRDLPRYFALNQQIHAAILGCTRNTILLQLYEQVSARVRRARFSANLSDARWAEAIAEHDQILATLKARDGAGLARILQLHLDHKFKAVTEALRATSLNHGPLALPVLDAGSRGPL